MKNMKHILIAIVLIISSVYCQSREVRSLWALPWDISSRDKIEQLVADAVSNNQTEILAEVRYRSDAMYIPNKHDSLYYNPEPRSYILPKDDFDPLEYLIISAHEFGLSVQAWVSTLNATPTSSSYLRSNYVYKNHSDWIMTDVYGNRMNAASAMGYFVDPGIPDVKYHLMNVLLDIVTNYPELDGIHLDYIRYPAKNLGYAPESVARYREKDTLNDISWNDWRIAQITDFITDLRELALTINPKIMITAAVIADLDEAKVHYAQDWVKWINDGIVDRVYPMAYSKGYDRFYDIAANIAAQTPKEKVIMGLRAWQEKGESYYSVDRIIEKANICRQMGFGGLALFSYDGIRQCDYFPELTQNLFQNREPTEGVIPEEDFISELINSLESNPTTIDTVAVVNNEGSGNNQVVNDISAADDSTMTKSYCDNISVNKNSYSLSFYFNVADDWSWTILDANNNVVFNKKKSYPRGYFVEEWDGIGSSGGAIQPGVYTLRMSDYKDMYIFEKRFIIN